MVPSFGQNSHSPRVSHNQSILGPALAQQYQPKSTTNSGPYQNKGKQHKSSNRPQCQICKKHGHTADVCYSRYQPPTNASQPQANIAGHSNGGYILDPGASNHVTNELVKLNLATDYTGTDSRYRTARRGESYAEVRIAGTFIVYMHHQHLNSIPSINYLYTIGIVA